MTEEYINSKCINTLLDVFLMYNHNMFQHRFENQKLYVLHVYLTANYPFEQLSWIKHKKQASWLHRFYMYSTTHFLLFTTSFAQLCIQTRGYAKLKHFVMRLPDVFGCLVHCAHLPPLNMSYTSFWSFRQTVKPPKILMYLHERLASQACDFHRPKGAPHTARVNEMPTCNTRLHKRRTP